METLRSELDKLRRDNAHFRGYIEGLESKIIKLKTMATTNSMIIESSAERLFDYATIVAAQRNEIKKLRRGIVIAINEYRIAGSFDTRKLALLLPEEDDDDEF